MCGIAGILRLHDPKDGPPPHPLTAIPEAWLDVLDESIKHRGPDGQGRFRDRATREDGMVVDIAFVHRRLSIIDHEGGRQPMVHDGERLRPDLTYQPGETPKLAHELCPASEAPDLVAVVFNGCIYNHRELRTELEAAGHVFETDHSDTEVLVHGWRAWGLQVADRSEMMASIGLWTRDIGDLITVRDFFGEKPLYAATASDDESDQSFAFSSCVPGLESIARLWRQDDPLVLYDRAVVGWISQGGSDWFTPWMHVHPHPRASTVSQTVAPEQHAPRTSDISTKTSPPRKVTSTKLGLRSFLPYTNRGIEKLRAGQVERAIWASIRERLDADAPVACLLSGGIDSSLVSLYARRALNSRVTTICVRMPSAGYDESKHAAQAANIIGSDHHTIDVEPEPASDLLRLIPRLGLPFGDSSLLPTAWACQAAAEHAKVLLTGDGGDELFLGYERYHTGVFAFALLPLCLFPTERALPRRDPKSKWTKLARLIGAVRWLSYASLTSIYQRGDARSLVRRPMPLSGLFTLSSDPVNHAEADLADHFPGILLRKLDAASMDVPIETRAPLLDRRVVEVAHAEYRRFGAQRTRKGILRLLAKRSFPAELVDRPKQGFAIPVGDWFRSDYGGMRQLLYDHLESADPFPGLGEAGVQINMAFVRRMLREHDAAGEKSLNPWHGRDHSQRLYMLLVLSIWAKWLERVRATPARAND